ncbi:ATP synthase subunit 4, mitochondrial [Neolecta irregularis DAH-3]|uniref:ATP synthase subunit 4 n=1 Tax=Neolecta irregularis (strain DAH-3) TaxID=1198029 RepID=A0A1U7LV54_NEOID|nr:ATP synthase subunit 4, mitochondrial [Neolecta irregularis DAH-3]|eukprot:OLL26498.1 ATP synthase subunit 4, mitochondrial [Neolecta irregularis DAH-3]
MNFQIYCFSNDASVPRYHSTHRPDPKTKVQSLIQSLPGNSLMSKTGIITAATGLASILLSKEIYVVNEETVILIAFSIVLYLIAKTGSPAYVEWAEGHINRMKSVLNKAREDHTQAVKDRIDSVSEMKGVVDVTKALFAVSKETVQEEAKAYELEQKVAFAREAKVVLDSWVRYEVSVRQSEQKTLAESVIAKIQKELSNPKFQQQILQQSIADVERIVAGAKA